jgi:hypothetical protein
MQNKFTHVNQFYHSLVSAVCRGRIISLNSTPTMRDADCPSFLAMTRLSHTSPREIQLTENLENWRLGEEIRS